MVEQTPDKPPFSALVLTFGIAGVVIGVLIATLNPEGSGVVPGVVILVIGVALAIPGQLAFRRALARTRYRLPRKWTLGAALVLPVGFAILIGGSIGLTMALDRLAGIRIPGAVFILAGIPIIMFLFLSARTELLINKLGINLAGMVAPWDSVQKVIITRQPDPSVTVHRQPPADPPPGDHGDPTATLTSDRIDPDRIVDAVARFGPAGVPVEVTDRPVDEDRTH